MGKLPDWTALVSFETVFLDFSSFHICLKSDFMWLQPNLKVSVLWEQACMTKASAVISINLFCLRSCLLLNLVLKKDPQDLFC